MLGIAAAIFACAPATEREVPPATGSGLRIATWNVHDLFDESDRTTPPGEEDLVLTAAQVQAKLAAVGKVLARIDADVLVLQEVENAGLLERLAAEWLPGRGYRAFLREGHDPRGIDVGVLSRIPFEPGPSHLDERGPDGRRLWSRDVIELRIGPETQRVVVLGAHLVSRLDPSEDGRRLDQANRLRQIAEAIGTPAATRGAPATKTGEASAAPSVLIVGDLNDVPGSAAIAALVGDGAFSDLGSALEPRAGWTWGGGGVHERIDYALLDRGAPALVTRVEVMQGGDVAAASDHRPLVVDLWTAPPGR